MLSIHGSLLIVMQKIVTPDSSLNTGAVRSCVTDKVEYAFQRFAEHGGDSECGFQ